MIYNGIADVTLFEQILQRFKHTTSNFPPVDLSLFEQSIYLLLLEFRPMWLYQKLQFI